MAKQNMEETIFDSSLPVNTLAMLDRAKELLQGAGVNCATSLTKTTRMDYKKILWLLNQQIYGGTAKIDLMEEWSKFTQASMKKE